MRNAVMVMGAMALAACGDLTPTGPEVPRYDSTTTATDMLERADMSEQAQARLAQIFEATSADVMALSGTVFADHDERVGKLVFGVRNANAAAGVRRSLIARGLSAADFDVVQTEEIV